MSEGEEREIIEFTPLGLTKQVKLKVLSDRRPDCCPDKKDCKPIHISPFMTQEDLDKGYSGSCYGYCGKQAFGYKEAAHENDISHCVITPLKGVVRFFNRVDDFGNDLFDLKHLFHMLNPRQCEECKVTDESETITGYLDRTADEPNDAPRRFLCKACALRLDVIKFHPEETGRGAYF